MTETPPVLETGAKHYRESMLDIGSVEILFFRQNTVCNSQAVRLLVNRFFNLNRVILCGMKQERGKDIILMTIAIQLSIIGTEPRDGSLMPLFFIGVLITVLVILNESIRHLSEYSNR